LPVLSKWIADGCCSGRRKWMHHEREDCPYTAPSKCRHTCAAVWYARLTQYRQPGGTITLPGAAASTAVGRSPSHTQAARRHVVLRLGASILNVRLETAGAAAAARRSQCSTASLEDRSSTRRKREGATANLEPTKAQAILLPKLVRSPQRREYYISGCTGTSATAEHGSRSVFNWASRSLR